MLSTQFHWYLHPQNRSSRTTYTLGKATTTRPKHPATSIAATKLWRQWQDARAAAAPPLKPRRLIDNRFNMKLMPCPLRQQPLQRQLALPPAIALATTRKPRWGGRPTMDHPRSTRHRRLHEQSLCSSTCHGQGRSHTDGRSSQSWRCRIETWRCSARKDTKQRLQAWFAPDVQEQARQISAQVSRWQRHWMNGASRNLGGRLLIALPCWALRHSPHGSWGRSTFAPKFNDDGVAGHRQKGKPLTLILVDGRYFKAMHPPKTQRTLKPWLFQTKIELDKVTIDLTRQPRPLRQAATTLNQHTRLSSHAQSNADKEAATFSSRQRKDPRFQRRLPILVLDDDRSASKQTHNRMSKRQAQQTLWHGSVSECLLCKFMASGTDRMQLNYRQKGTLTTSNQTQIGMSNSSRNRSSRSALCRLMSWTGALHGALKAFQPSTTEPYEHYQKGTAWTLSVQTLTRLCRQAKNHRENPDAHWRLQKRHASRSATYKRIHAERRDLQRSGQNLVAFEPHWPTWKPATIQQSWHQGPVVTCTQYRTFGPYLFFFQTCELPRMCIFHQLDDINKQIWSKHWSINIEEANGSDHARSNDNLSALSKDLAKSRD